jgi:hypothetical protein
MKTPTKNKEWKCKLSHLLKPRSIEFIDRRKATTDLREAKSPEFGGFNDPSSNEKINSEKVNEFKSDEGECLLAADSTQKFLTLPFSKPSLSKATDFGEVAHAQSMEMEYLNQCFLR